jgi:uncharacterized DUF497 family protein
MFDWVDANISHVAMHEVAPHEAEEAYDSNPLYVDYLVEHGEIRYREIGEIRSGRVLVVVSTMRGEMTRIVTAYEDRPSTLTYFAFKESEHRGR